jgi:enamine deaminase RidA (YjgF/YER057c/UK114 family)
LRCRESGALGSFREARFTSKPDVDLSKPHYSGNSDSETLRLEPSYRATIPVYLAGRIGIDPKTGRPPEDLEQEIRIALDGMKATLAEAGMTMDDLAYVQVFCPDLTLYEKFNATYRTCFGKNFPARAFVGSGPLLRGGHFEVQGIAVKQ